MGTIRQRRAGGDGSGPAGSASPVEGDEEVSVALERTARRQWHWPVAMRCSQLGEDFELTVTLYGARRWTSELGARELGGLLFTVLSFATRFYAIDTPDSIA